MDKTFAYIFYIVLIAVLAFVGYKMGERHGLKSNKKNEPIIGAVLGGGLGVLVSFGLYEAFVKPKTPKSKLSSY